MTTIFFSAITIIAIAIHLFVVRKKLDAPRALGIVIVWALAILVGVQNIVSTGFHVFDAAGTARMIGWAPGSPFQFENAMGDLAFGVLGLLSIRFRGLFWLATAVGFAIQSIGDGYGHIYQLLVNHDTAASNTGGIMIGDIVIPIVILLLLAAYYSRVRVRSARGVPSSAAPEPRPAR
ncbi:MAG: DUF6790 family protein [Candidatus Dormibacteraceae bacterium]